MSDDGLELEYVDYDSSEELAPAAVETTSAGARQPAHRPRGNRGGKKQQQKRQQRQPQLSAASTRSNASPEPPAQRKQRVAQRGRSRTRSQERDRRDGRAPDIWDSPPRRAVAVVIPKLHKGDQRLTKTQLREKTVLQITCQQHQVAAIAASAYIASLSDSAHRDLALRERLSSQVFLLQTALNEERKTAGDQVAAELWERRELRDLYEKLRREHARIKARLEDVEAELADYKARLQNAEAELAERTEN